ncbi:Arv1-like family protein [Dictyocaulus viviparus]|uniref:Protein ARV n=1 Tax=Dictyocaulus viviparus TaxID=29172 RepID=A0A0D8Y4F4_DICVI|nr:Arv1-like family protein [Dictyocaulus viviparus]
MFFSLSILCSVNAKRNPMSRTDYMCVNCMEPATTLYQSYSEGNRCNEVVDKYVEYDTMLVVIDLIIHNISAYRHLIYNMEIQSYLRLATIFLLCDAYGKWISERAGVYNIYDLEWIFYKSFLQSVIEMVTYVLIIVIYDLKLNAYRSERIATVIRGTVLGYYDVFSSVFCSNPIASFKISVFYEFHPNLV